MMRLAAVCAMLVLAATPAWAQDASAWDAIAERAKAAKPGVYSAERAALQERDNFKRYYEGFKDWAPPADRAMEGKLQGLREKPTAPRFALTGKVWPEKVGEASVCLWEDDKTAAYSFSIDDNNAMDVKFWLELSKKYGDLKITWNLIAINIDGTFSKGRVGSAGTWELWRSVVAQGYHVASHSMTHVGDPVKADGWPGPAWEAVESVRILDEHLPTRKTKLFAYPGSALKEFNGSGAWRGEISRYVAAARGGSGNPINIANQTDYYDIRTTANPVGILPSAEMKIPSFNIANIINDNAAPEFRKYYRGWATTFIHSVNGGKDWETNPGARAHAAVFDWVTAHRDEIWIGFLDDVAFYGQERDTAKLETLGVSESRIELALTSQMDPAVFDYPLTLKVRVPQSWNRVAARQGNKTLPCQPLAHGGNSYVLVKAIPGMGNVAITPAE